MFFIVHILMLENSEIEGVGEKGPTGQALHTQLFFFFNVRLFRIMFVFSYKGPYDQLSSQGQVQFS